MLRLSAAAAALAATLILALPSAYGEHHAPLSRWSGTATQIGRPAFVLGGGWPAAFVELDYGVNDILAVGLRGGYLFASPHGGLRLAHGGLIEIPARLRVLARGSVELSVEICAGLTIGSVEEPSETSEETDIENARDWGIATIDPALVGSVRPIGPSLSAGLIGSWRLSDQLQLKFGVDLSAIIVMSMAEPPVEDVIELTASLDPFVGITYSPLPWMSVFFVAGAGPALVWAPVDWTADHFEHEIRVEPHVRGAAGLVFTPWP